MQKNINKINNLLSKKESIIKKINNIEKYLELLTININNSTKGYDYKELYSNSHKQTKKENIYDYLNKKEGENNVK